MGNRIIELDVLRGIAAIIVVLFHYTFRYNFTFDTNTMSLFEFSYGHYGVQLFFIISGFVIFMTLERSKTTFDFIKRRFIRLYPTFWICMFLTFSVTLFADIDRFERTFLDLIVNISMIPNLLGFKAIDGVYWSLEVELLFYFLMALLLKYKLFKFTYVILLTWLFSGVIIHYFQLPYLNVLLIIRHSYLFIAGISFYKIWKNETSNNLKHHILILICLVYGFAKNTEEGVVVLICFALFYLFVYRRLQFLTNYKLLKPFIFLGDISYALYLIHQFIGMIIIFYLSYYIDNYFILLITPLFISILLAWVITSFDKKLQPKLKNKLF